MPPPGEQLPIPAPARPTPEELAELTARLDGLGDPLGVLRALFAFAPVGFQIYSRDGRSLVTNRAFRELFGAEPPPEYNVLEDDIARENGVLDLIHRAFQGETIHIPPLWYDPRELRQVDVPQGRRAAVSATFMPLASASGEVQYVAIAFKDVTAEWEERDRLEVALEQNEALAAELRQAQERLEQTLEAANVGTWEWRVADNRVVWSANIERIFGLPDGAFAGTYEAWLQLVHPEDRPRMSQTVAEALANKSRYEAEFRVMKPDGSVGWQSTSAYVVVGTNGEAVAVRGVVVDTTARKRAELALVERADFEQQLIGIVSHDLKGPLSAIDVSAALLLRRGNLDAQQARTLGRIVSSAERAMRLIGDLLDFSRVRQSGQMPIVRRPMDLHKVMRTVVDELQLTHPERPIEVSLDGDGRGEWDEDRLAQLLSNLLGNALQHSPPAARVGVHALGRGEHVELRVSNDGPPIPDELRPLLFLPFRRGAETAGSSARNVGLGLYISRHIVLAHGGSIGVSAPGEPRTTFTVHLPRADRRAAE